MSEDQWMTTAQVAELFQVTEETIRRWIRAGELPVLDLGARKGGYRIRRADIDAFIRQRYGPILRAARGADQVGPEGKAAA